MSTSPWPRQTSIMLCVFFFQAEDGIRDIGVTGVQTCALPISGSSAATTSPGATWTSMTGTSVKSPMSGMRMSTEGSRATGWVVLEDEAADVLEQVAQVPGEAGGGRAVDHPVVVGQGERQHQPRHERGAVPDRGGLRTHDAQDGDLGGVHQRGERRPADAAQAGDGEAAPLQVGGGQLAVPGARGHLAELAAELPDPLAVDVADDRDDQALRRVDGDADVEVPLEDRKSTRLNSSHANISYAASCLKNTNTTS